MGQKPLSWLHDVVGKSGSRRIPRVNTIAFVLLLCRLLFRCLLLSCASGRATQAVEAVLCRLTEVSLLDDARYAEAWARTRWGRQRRAPAWIRRQLLLKGMSPQDVDTGLRAVFGRDMKVRHRRYNQRGAARLEGGTSLLVAAAFTPVPCQSRYSSELLPLLPPAVASEQHSESCRLPFATRDPRSQPKQLDPTAAVAEVCDSDAGDADGDSGSGVGDDEGGDAAVPPSSSELLVNINSWPWLEDDVGSDVDQGDLIRQLWAAADRHLAAMPPGISEVAVRRRMFAWFASRGHDAAVFSRFMRWRAAKGVQGGSRRL